MGSRALARGGVSAWLLFPALLSVVAHAAPPPATPARSPSERTIELRLEVGNGEWIEEPSGFVECTVMKPRGRGGWSGGPRASITIDKGRFVVALEPDDYLSVTTLVLEGRFAVLAPGHPKLEYGDGTPLRLAARVARAVTLDVVAAESGAPLHGVQVILGHSVGSRLGWFGPPLLFPALVDDSSLQPESDWPLPGTSVADGISPLQIAVPRGSWVLNQSLTTLRIGAPGRVWALVEVDWFVGGRARVELQRGGSLAIRATGIESVAELARRLAVARPPTNSAEPSALFGVSAATSPSLDPRSPFEPASSSPIALLLAPLAPDGFDPQELEHELEVDEELEWQASLSEEERAALFGDTAPPDATQLSERISRQNRYLPATLPIAAQRITLGSSDTLHHLPPGRYRLLAGDAGNVSSRNALGAVDVEVVAGETTTIEVPLDLPADGPFVPLVGTIRWPRGTALERFTFWWEPLDGDERRPRDLVGPHELPADEHGSVGATALESWREVRLGTVRPGRWRIHEPALGLEWDVTVTDEPGASGAHRFELVVPELAEIDVTLIDAATDGLPSDPLRLRRALHRSIAGRLPVTMSRARSKSPDQRTPPKREHRQKLVTVAGAVRLEIVEEWLPSGVYLDQEEHWFEPGRHEVTLNAVLPTVISVDWSTIEASAVEQSPTETSAAERVRDRELERALRRARLVPLDRDGPPLFADLQRWRAGWFRLPSAGRYRLELAVPPGDAPLPPREIEARAGEIVPVTVELPRRK